MNYPAQKFFMIFAVSLISLPGAYASECSTQIDQLRQVLSSRANQPSADGSAPQTVGAQLDRQPTPASVAQAEQGAHADVEAVLKQAESDDAAGKGSACLDAVGKARTMLNP